MKQMCKYDEGHNRIVGVKTLWVDEGARSQLDRDGEDDG